MFRLSSGGVAVLALLSMQTPSLERSQSVGVEQHAQVSPQLTLLGLTLGKNTLGEVVAKLGKSEIRRCSHEEEAPKELCYISAGPDRTKVVFQAGFSGGWTELDGYKVISGDLNRDCYRQCARSAVVSAGLRAGSGLRLGLTRHEVTDMLGMPRRTKANELTFEWHSREPMTKEETEKESKTFGKPVKEPYWDVQDTIGVIFRGSTVVELDVRHTVTY